jgi:leucyl-tRNA synthetase
MKMLNALQEAVATPVDAGARQSEAFKLALHESVSVLLRILAPITPHVGHVLWRDLGYAGDVMDAPWPDVDQAALETDEIDLVLQVNGKLRGHLRVAKSADRTAIEALARMHPAVDKFTNGQPPKKIVVVPGRLVNVVV